mgnify:CR=1 FL=1
MVSLAAERISVVRTDRRLLDSVSFATGESGSIAIIGPNGAGKSTLLKVLAGLETPTEGTVTLAGEPLAGMPAARRSDAIGYVPQHFNPHWDIRVRDLMRISLERARLENNIQATLQLTLARHGLEAFRDRWWSTLSGGERSRVLLAMVVATDPPVLLADEPSASLDPRCRLDLIARIADHGRTGVCVVVMHDIDLAFRFFDRIVMMNGGRIVADGSADSLFEPSLLDDMFGVRFARSRQEDLRFISAGWPLRSDGKSP